MGIKFQEIKEAISNPPPERLAKIEYQSHLLQAFGILVVCAFLIYNGLWYIIFALIFGVGVSYSQGITAYHKYKAILSILGKEYDPEKDKSPSRRRDYIIQSEVGKSFWYFSILISLIITYIIIGTESWYHKLSFPFFAIFFHILTYYFLFYSIIVFMCKNKRELNFLAMKKMKGGNIE